MDLKRRSPLGRWLCIGLLIYSYCAFPETVDGFPWPHRHHKHPVELGKIKTIVLLIMENRSFDHMLGFLKRLKDNVDGLTGAEYNYANVTDPTSRKVFVNDHAEYIDPDPGHSFQAIREQVFGGADMWQLAQDPAPMCGFAQQAESIMPGFSHRVMSAFRSEVLPAYTAAAMEFAVCDRWFAGVPASTQPNRLFIHSATSHGAVCNAARTLARGFPQKTIYDSVEESGLDFGVYFQNIPSVLFLKRMREPRHALKIHPWELFKLRASEGKLENLVLLEPAYFDILGRPANDDHPSHDVAEGQKLIREVYRILRSSPQWKEMALIVTYDEHGGFFDHVPTPVRGVPSPDGIRSDIFNFNFDRLGVRVPTFVISPWVEKGAVINEVKGPTPTSQYEHASVAATIKKILNLRSDFLTERDRWAATFEHIFDQRDTPRDDCPEELGSTVWPLRHAPPDENADLTEWQEELVQLAGQLVGDYRMRAGEMTQENGLKMTVKQANEYVEAAVKAFLTATKSAWDKVAEEGEEAAENMDVVIPGPIPLPTKKATLLQKSWWQRTGLTMASVVSELLAIDGEKDM